MNIGIDLGGSHIGIGLVNENGIIVNKREISITRKENMEEFIIEQISKIIYDILQEQNMKLKDVNFIGLGTPGETKNGIIKRIVNLGIEDFEIIKNLKNNLNFQNIAVRNDGKCAALAEKKYGSIKDFDDCVFLCLGTGIGGAVFMNGKMLKPKRYSGFEIGHMIIEKNGKTCNCGSKGCFETYCSMKRLKNKIRQNTNNEHLKGENLAQFVRENLDDIKIKYILEEYINDLVIGISNIINIFEPECISLGGGFVYYTDILYDKLIDSLNKKEFIFNKELLPEIILAKLGNDAGIIGASIDN